MAVSFPRTLPRSRIPDPMEAPSLNWGILGTGWIAERFVTALLRSTGQNIAAVGSRNAETAVRFADRFGIARAYSSYEALVEDPTIDIVYVATPHTEHLAGSILALNAGRHVLVEKPLGINRLEATTIAETAVRNGLFCAEALWTYFLPKFDVIGQLISRGVLGDISSVMAEYGEHFTAGHRIMRRELAGGPLLDLGTYPVSFVEWVLGPSTAVLAAGQPHPSGVNAQAAAILTTAGGRQGIVGTTMLNGTPSVATIAGSGGTVVIDGPFYKPGGFSLISVDGKDELRYEEPHIGHEALYFEAADVARAISAGATESSIRPLRDSIQTIATMDEIRAQIGITFPGETSEQT